MVRGGAHPILVRFDETFHDAGESRRDEDDEGNAYPEKELVFLHGIGIFPSLLLLTPQHSG